MRAWPGDFARTTVSGKLDVHGQGRPPSLFPAEVLGRLCSSRSKEILLRTTLYLLFLLCWPESLESGARPSFRDRAPPSGLPICVRSLLLLDFLTLPAFSLGLLFIL